MHAARLLVLAAFFATIPNVVSGGSQVIFPNDPAVVDARRDFGAVGDGLADDTAALQHGLEASWSRGKAGTKILFLPNGIYRVTNTLVVKSGVGPWVYGQSRDGVVIRLADGVPTNVTSVIRTHPSDTKATSADFFMRNFRNLTIDVGNNPETDGIRWYGNNSSSLKNVRVIGTGRVGVNSGFLGQNGPNLIQDVVVEGSFETGVRCAWSWGQTLSRVTVRNARKEGVYVNSTAVGIEDLVVENAPVALRNEYPNDWTWWGGVVALVGGRFTGGVPDQPAITNSSVLYARNVTTAGYKQALISTTPGGSISGTSISEYTSHPVKKLFTNSPNESIKLPIVPEPDLPWETNLANWACANNHGAVAGDNQDDTAAIQAAIDAAAAANKTTVYFRGIGGGDPNWYTLNGEVRVHGSVRHLIALGFGRIVGGPNGRFVVDDTSAPVVKFQHFQAFGARPPVVENRSATHKLVVESCDFKILGSGRGDIFVTDCPSSVELRSADQRLWARQLNPEGTDDLGLVRNHGGKLWALGVKHEGAGVRFRTDSGGQTEILGLFNYGPGIATNDLRPMFEVDNASFCATGVREISFGNTYPVKVRETRDGETRAEKGGGWIGWALYSGWTTQPANRAILPTKTATNLLRNGSFEGGMLYWHNLGQGDYALVRGEAAAGEYCLRINKGYAMSAPFVARRGEAFTVSFFVRGDEPGVVDVSMPPSAREVGQKAGRLWVRGAGQTAHFGTNWQRASFTWPADVPPDGFWPNPHYLVQIGGGATTLPIYVDGVTVTSGRVGTSNYVPRRDIEVLADCADLPGYRSNGNLLEKGAAARVIAHAANPGQGARELTLRWQLVDYEGEHALGQPIEKRVTIPGGKTVSETISLPLIASGCVLARVSALDLQGSVIDTSDLPLTTLPYPFGPRKPDLRERFGGSFFGPHTARLGSQLGFGWSRWWPHTKWQDHQPKGPDDWRWFDRELDILEGLGISSHLVLYGWPKWIMDEGKHPLPQDMRWPANDPRWDDLGVETAWDRYIKTATAHYQGRAVIYEIENEPEFDHWDKFKDEYAKFTIRTARMIKQTDPKAKVMVNNVYGIPSALNRHLLERGAAKYIDIISWHDYHEGWLADAAAMKRMKAALAEVGGEHIEIWFNEGWTFSNTAVDEPLACTRLNAAEAANAMVASLAELTLNGQEKTILFHTGYEHHGMSFWDYSGPGTMLWDWYGYPLPLVAAWNTLAHHIGLSEQVAFVRPPGANFCIFEDLRNGRGVVVAYADRESRSDAVVELPFSDLTVEDVMGNRHTLEGKRLLLSKTGRPVYLYAANERVSGKTFAEKLTSLDRKHVSFVNQGGSTFHLPPTWEGVKKGSSEGNPALANGQPIWRLDQVFPPDPKKLANYRPLVWGDNYWVPLKDAFGGQPKAELKDRGIRLEFRAAHGQPQAERICGLTFIAPKAGSFSITGTAQLTMWDGGNPVRLMLLHKSTAGVQELGSMKLVKGGRISLTGFTATVAAGEELVLLPRIEGAFNGGDIVLRDLEVRAGAGAVQWRLPATWEGQRVGSAEGNPIQVQDKPVWRLDQLWPDDPIMAANYVPLVWNGSAWGVKAYGHGGQPVISVTDGSFKAAVRGPWTGPDLNHQRVAGLVFVAPETGVYRVAGLAKAKPWEGGAKSFRLSLRKKDTQRAAEVKTLELKREGIGVPFDLKVELTAGHELVFLPLMADWHNATHIFIDNLIVTCEEAQAHAEEKPCFKLPAKASSISVTNE